MGAPAIRITRGDFLTPPEFRELSLASPEAGRIGGARLELVYSGGLTRLGACYQQIPVRLFPPFQFDSEPAALLYLITLTAGLLDGDGHLIELTARAGTRAVVTGQSATRIHPALDRFATQQWSVEIEDDAFLVVLPGPAIPFQGSRYYQRGRVRLAPEARLIWGDIWLPGRYERGLMSERFQFERIVQDFEVYRRDRLVFRDRFHWEGPWAAEEVDWYLGGTLASGSLFVSGPVTRTLPDAGPGRASGIVSTRVRRRLHSLVWYARRGHFRTCENRLPPGRGLDRRTGCSALASVLVESRVQPLVLDDRGSPIRGCPAGVNGGVRDGRRQNFTRKLMPPVNWLIMVVIAVDSEGGGAGEVAANLRPDVEALAGVPVQSQGHLFILGLDTGSRALDVVEPFRATVEIDRLGQVEDADEVQAIQGAGADRSVDVPAHVVLEDLSETIRPVLLESQLHHGDEVPFMPGAAKIASGPA